MGFGDVGDVIRLERVGSDWSCFEVFLKYYNREFTSDPEHQDNSETNIVYQYQTY